MNYTLAIYAHPETNSNALLAYQFAATLLRQRHSITRLFFFGDGVYNGVVNEQQHPLPEQWQQLISEHQLDAVVCVTAAAERGIGNQSNQVRPLPGFDISGLGQLVEAATQSDRFVTFG